MSLSFARADITQTSQAERGTLTVLPLGKNKRQNKIALGDTDGVIQVVMCKREERVPIFKTLPGNQPVMSLIRGGAPEQEDKLFASTGQAVKGINKKVSKTEERGDVREGAGKGERVGKVLRTNEKGVRETPCKRGS